MLFFCKIASIMLALVLLFSGTAYSSTRERADAKALIRVIDKSYEDGDWNECIERIHEFFHLYKDENDPGNALDITHAYIMLGNVHMGFSDYASADRYYARGLAVARKWNHGENELKCLGNLAVTNCYLGNRSKAMKYASEMKEIIGVNPDLVYINNLYVMSFIERYFGNWRKSVGMMRKALEEMPRLNVSRKKISTPVSELADMYEEHGMLDSSLFYMRQYDSIADLYNMRNMQLDVQRLYMRVYMRLGDSQKALYHLEWYSRLRDSMQFNTRTFLNRARLFDEENIDRTNRRIETLQFTISRQQLFLIITGTLLLFAVVFATVIMRQKRRLDSSYRQLYEKNRQLMALETENPVANKDRDKVESTGEENGNRNELAAKILEAMENPEVWLDPDFSLQRLSDLVGSNTRYVSQAINDTFGKNFRSFTNQYRIREAMNRISDEANFGHLTIHSIGESVGFRSSSNFIAAFKKQTGLTPSFFQKMAVAEKNKTDKNA